MSVLVIGADGQVGHELLRSYAQSGPTQATTRSGRLPDGTGCYALDLNDEAAIRSVIAATRPALVINAAAYTAVDQAESEPELAMRVNAVAPGAISGACANIGASLVHFSTDYVFPGSGTAPLREDDPVAPKSAYGRSKLAGEQAVRHGEAPFKIFRLAWVYSARGRNFLRTMLRLAAEREELRVVDDQVGCPTPAHWIAEAVRQATSQQPSLTGTWHLTASGQTSWAGFAERIVERAHGIGLLARQPRVVRIGTADYPTPAARPAYSVLDCRRFEADFGARPGPWEAGLDEVLDRVAAMRTSD